MPGQTVMEKIEDAQRRYIGWHDHPNAVVMPPHLERRLREEILPPHEKKDVALHSVHTEMYGEIKIITSKYCPVDTIYFGEESKLRRMVENVEAEAREGKIK